MIIGITGSLGTGKTTVAKMLGRKGAMVLDADKLSHQALKSESATYKKIVSSFGGGMLNKDGSINKVKLAKIVFADTKKLKVLTGIIHPWVISEIKKSIKNIKPHKAIVIDAPLLIEAGLADIVEVLIVVKTDRRTQLLRCIKKTNLKKEELVARIRSQMPLARKIKMADYVIDNNGSLTETEKQVDEIWKKLRRKSNGYRRIKRDENIGA